MNAKHLAATAGRSSRIFRGTVNLAAAAAALLVGACVIYDGPPRRAVVVREPVVVRQAPVVVAPAPAPYIGAEVVAESAPPAPLAEVQMASPGVDFVWIPGVWVWEGRWVWTAGRWERPPHPGAIWVPHRYEYRNGAHVFIRGGWR